MYSVDLNDNCIKYLPFQSVTPELTTELAKGWHWVMWLRRGFMELLLLCGWG